MNVIDKDMALHEWAKNCPLLKNALSFDFLGGDNGDFSISPVSGAVNPVKGNFIDGSQIKHYNFAVQAMLPLSDSPDSVNISNLSLMRKWQDWIDSCELLGFYPDFGEKCGCYELRNLTDIPKTAIRFDNGMAKYQFFAALIYEEDL